MDYSKLSDEELLQEYQSKQLAQRAMAAGGSDNYLNDVTGRTSPDYSKMSDEELLRMAGLSKPPPVVTPQPKTGPMVSGDDLTRVAGRTGRTLASGAATLADIPGMLLKAGGDLGYDTGRKAVNVFSPDLASYMPPRRTETIPLPSEGVRRTIDQLTGNRFAPQNRLEKAVDTAGEFMAGLGTGNLVNQAAGLTTEAVRKAPASLDTIVNSMQARKTADLTAAAGAGIGQEYGGLPGAIAGAYIGGKVGGIPEAVSNKPKQLTSKDLNSMANAAYEKVARNGEVIPETFANKFVDTLEASKPKPIAGKVLTSEDSVIINALDDYKPLRGNKMTFQDVQRIDESLSDKIDGALDAGRVTKTARKLIDVQDRFREMVSTMDGGIDLKNARDLWSRQARMRDVERIIERAQLTDNPASAIKTGFKNLLTSDKRIRGFSEAEREAIRKAAKGGIGTDFLRIFGSRLNPIIAGTVGGPGAAAATQVSSMASRSMADKLQMDRANEVARLIAGQNSPARQPSTFGLLTTDAAKQIKSAPRDLGRGLLSIMRDQSGGGWSP